MERYSLSSTVRYRREGFGGIVLQMEHMTTRFYNQTAATIIELCAHSRTADEIAQILGYEGERSGFHLGDFLGRLVAHQVLVVTPHQTESEAELFFTNVTQFPETHLYMPLGVEMEMTLKCYRNCTYCAYESNSQVSTSGELALARWQEILQNLYENGIFYLRFTGGDPFARPDFPALLRYADDMGFAVSLGSDLTILTPEHVAMLASLQHLSLVQTTLDGASPETADRMRGSGCFDKVVRGMKMFQEAGVPFIVGTVLSKHNIGEIGAIARLVASFGAKGYCIAPLYPAGRGRDLSDMVPSNDELASACQEFGQLVDAGVVKPADPAWLGMGLERHSDHLWDNQPFLIRPGDRLLRVDPTGRCYTSIKLKEHLDEAVYIGNIAETPLDKLWHEAPLLQRLRSLPSQESYFGRVVDVRTITESLPQNS